VRTQNRALRVVHVQQVDAASQALEQQHWESDLSRGERELRYRRDDRPLDDGAKDAAEDAGGVRDSQLFHAFRDRSMIPPL
jgi:hypothetical protein